jgi:hypothetical protein
VADQIRIDHVIYGVRDLEAAVGRFASEYGLHPVAMAKHEAWGTRNAVIPLGYGQFLELLAIADATAETPLVKGLQRLLVAGDRMAGVCLRPVDFDAVVQRLSLRVMPGERDEGARVVRLRRTVVESNPGLPFFIDWQGAEREQDARYAADASTQGIPWVELGGDEQALRRWVGDDTAPLRFVGGGQGAQRFAVLTKTGTEIVVE